MERAEKSRNHRDIAQMLQHNHLYQMPLLQQKGIAAIQHLLCTSKPEELATIAGDVSSVATDMRQREWAAHAPINDSQKNDILVAAEFVAGVANVIETAQEAHKSETGAALSTDFREALGRILQTVVEDTKPVSSGNGCAIDVKMTNGCQILMF